MGAHTRNPRAGDAGARDRRLAERLDGPESSAYRRALQESARVDELLTRLGVRLDSGRLSKWETGFAKSVLRQARRVGPRWMPSPRQLEVMEEIVERSTGPAEDEVLIEEDLPDGWIP